MNTKMTMTPAALSSCSESAFVVPTGADAFWQLAVSHGIASTVDISGRDAFGSAATRAHDTQLPVSTPAPTAVRNRMAAKQGRPPRGVPR